MCRSLIQHTSKVPGSARGVGDPEMTVLAFMKLGVQDQGNEDSQSLRWTLVVSKQLTWPLWPVLPHRDPKGRQLPVPVAAEGGLMQLSFCGVSPAGTIVGHLPGEGKGPCLPWPMCWPEVPQTSGSPCGETPVSGSPRNQGGRPGPCWLFALSKNGPFEVGLPQAGSSLGGPEARKCVVAGAGRATS